MAVRGRPCLVSSWRISHFGANPVRGGRPPSERRIKVARYARTGVCAHVSARLLILVEAVILSVRKTEEVIIT